MITAHYTTRAGQTLSSGHKTWSQVWAWCYHVHAHFGEPVGLALIRLAADPFTFVHKPLEQRP